METEEIEIPNEKSSRGKWIALVVVIILLVAAAFVAGRLFNARQGQQAEPQFTGPGLAVGGGNGPGFSNGDQAFQLNMIPAEELPKTQPDATGLFVRAEDNSIFIGTGKMTMSMSEGGAPTSSFDGPVVEVVVNGDTTIYKEVTDLPDPAAGQVLDSIQQKVAPGKIEDLGENSNLIVWGRKVGDRIIADILLYSEPVFMVKPAP